MTKNNAIAIDELLRYLNEQDVKLDIVEYEKGKYDWDTKLGSKLTRREVINYADKILAPIYELPFGWLRTTLDECIALGKVPYKTGEYWMEEVISFLKDNDASVTLVGGTAPYVLEGLSEEKVQQFHQIVRDIAKRNGYLADWFILEARRLFNHPNGVKHQQFNIKRDSEPTLYKSECLEHIDAYLGNHNYDLYFGKTGESMIIATTDDNVGDEAFLHELEDKGYIDSYEEELVRLWNSGNCTYDHIRFRADNNAMVADLINCRLLATKSTMLINKETGDCFIVGADESIAILARLCSFASVYKLVEKDSALVTTIRNAIEEDCISLSRIHIIEPEAFPTAQSATFAAECAKLFEYAKCPVHKLGSPLMEEALELICKIEGDKDTYAFLQILLSAATEREGISLNYIAAEKLKQLSSYSYVDNGDGTFTVVQDTKEVLI